MFNNDVIFVATLLILILIVLVQFIWAISYLRKLATGNDGIDT